MLKSLRRIHEDERGLETLQVVAIIAIAAIVLAVVRLLWNNVIKNWFQTSTQDVTKWN